MSGTPGFELKRSSSDLLASSSSIVENFPDSYEWQKKDFVGLLDNLQDWEVSIKNKERKLKSLSLVKEEMEATALLSQLQSKIKESQKAILDLLIESLSNIGQIGEEDLVNQLSKVFTLDDALMFGPLDFNHVQGIAFSKESLPSDGEFPAILLREG